MSFSISDAFVLQFSGNVRMLAQQQRARIRGCCTEDTITGEAAYLEQIAPTAARKIQHRHEDSPIMNTQHLRRRVAPYGYEWGDLIDREDRARTLIDPTSAYSMNASYAMARAWDDEFIAATFGTAYAGHSGSTAITWPNGSGESTPAQPAGTQVAVNDWTYGNGSGNAGLTISKMISAQVALLAAEGDEDEECYMTITAKDIGNLLATTEYTSSDYNAVQALRGAKIQGNSFMGFTFVHSERVLLNGSGQRRLIAWRKSGIGMGILRDVEARAGERADKRFSQYVYASESIGASRLEENKVAEVICA